MLILLSAFLSTLGSIFSARYALELENLALRYQIGVLERSVRKRAKLMLPTAYFGCSRPGSWTTGARH